MQVHKKESIILEKKLPYLEIRQSEVGFKLYLGGIESCLSSGYQALLRIFMEMEYIQRTMKKFPRKTRQRTEGNDGENGGSPEKSSA